MQDNHVTHTHTHMHMYTLATGQSWQPFPVALSSSHTMAASVPMPSVDQMEQNALAELCSGERGREARCCACSHFTVYVRTSFLTDGG